MKWSIRVLLFALAVALAWGIPTTPAMAQDRDPSDRWEIEFHLGGVAGQSFGTSGPQCIASETPGYDDDGDGGFVAATNTRSCDLTNDFTDGNDGDAENLIGIFPTAVGHALPSLLTTGGVKPGRGPVAGARIGFDLTSHLQLEFTFNYSAMPVAFTNDLSLADQAINLFCNEESFDECGGDRNLQFLDRGAPRGNQQMYLLNLNYNFEEMGRLVPYVGGGGGVVKWYNGPNIVIFHNRPREIQGVRANGLFFKNSGNDSTFAVDMKFGVKYHVTRHFGVRVEVMDVVSWPGFDHQFGSLDIAGQLSRNALGGSNNDTAGELVAPTGTLHQGYPMNQLLVTGGVFVRF